jgi:hypothetical protein
MGRMWLRDHLIQTLSLKKWAFLNSDDVIICCFCLALQLHRKTCITVTPKLTDYNVFFGIAPKMHQGKLWCRFGADLVQIWCRFGADLVQIWCNSKNHLKTIMFST